MLPLSTEKKKRKNRGKKERKPNGNILEPEIMPEAPEDDLVPEPASAPVVAAALPEPVAVCEPEPTPNIASAEAHPTTAAAPSPVVAESSPAPSPNGKKKKMKVKPALTQTAPVVSSAPVVSAPAPAKPAPAPATAKPDSAPAKPVSAPAKSTAGPAKSSPASSKSMLEAPVMAVHPVGSQLPAIVAAKAQEPKKNKASKKKLEKQLAAQQEVATVAKSHLREAFNEQSAENSKLTSFQLRKREEEMTNQDLVAQIQKLNAKIIGLQDQLSHLQQENSILRAALILTTENGQETKHAELNKLCQDYAKLIKDLVEKSESLQAD